MSGRRRTVRPATPPCRLCGELAQPTIHFDADYWADVKKSVERVLAEARAEIAEADKHLRMLAADRTGSGSTPHAVAAVSIALTARKPRPAFPV